MSSSDTIANTRADRALQAAGTAVRAAAYVRASTHEQQYSTANQTDAIRAYAADRGMEIVRIYADDGKSGLSIERRDALKQLLDDVLTGKADFAAILVYDVSRWGRYQDADESAYYEYVCRRAGIEVHYCAEQFENDGNLYSAIVKSIKRAMAAEFSRELSVKVFTAQARLVKLGYAQGGHPGYGLRRLLIDRHGVPRAGLSESDRKSITTDRVVLVPGPPQEVEAIRWIFEAFVGDRKSRCQIARILNQRGIAAVNGRAWTSKFVKRVLCSERYIGDYVWNRASTKLNAKRVCNAPDKWIRAEGVIEPIVARPVFIAAQEIIRARLHNLSHEKKLEPLRRLLREHGFLNCRLIRESANVPAVGSYHRWFGGLLPAYKLIGYTGCRQRSRYPRITRGGGATNGALSDDDLLDLLRQPLQKHGYLTRSIINKTKGVPHSQTYLKQFGSMARVYQLLSRFPEHPANRPCESAERRINAVAYNSTNEQLLGMLREVLKVRGFLTREVIDASKSLPNSATYVYRFGGMARVYELIGYDHKRASIGGVKGKSQLKSSVSTVARENTPKC